MVCNHELDKYCLSCAKSLLMIEVREEIQEIRNCYLKQLRIIQKTLEDTQNELVRFKEGNLTAEEFMNFCHNKHGVSPEEHTLGCIEYQKKLYGHSNIEESINKGKIT